MNHFPEYREPASVLVVDDSPDNLSLMNGLLKDAYRVRVANNGARALKIAQSGTPPDLILLDVMMPCMDGYEVCRRLKADAGSRDIPIIFLTARSEPADEQLGLELGAVDYITKPVSPPIVLARVRTHLRLKSMADFLRDKNKFLMQEVTQRTREIMTVQEVTILALASLAETRDLATGFGEPSCMSEPWRNSSGHTHVSAIFSPKRISACSTSRRRSMISARWGYPTGYS
jgi:putative two-component system response regulator